MGLVEFALAAMCLNATCLEDSENIEYNKRKVFLGNLAEELKNENLIVTSLNNNRLSGIDVNKNNNSFYGKGIAFDLLEILRRKFHFQYSVVLPKENVWASSKNGILAMLKNKEVNLSAAFLPILAEYTTEISYSPSLDTGDWVVLMKRPKESATGSGLLAPFTLPVWLLILLSLLVVGPVIHCIILLQAKLCKDDHNRVFPLAACIWFVYGALLKQGTTLNPMTDSSRLLFATWWIFITILTAFYTANLTAFLTLSKFTLPINEAKDIGAKKYPWVTTKGNALEDTIGSTDLGTKLGRPVGFLYEQDLTILQTYVFKKDIMFIREKPIVEYVMYDDYKIKTKNNIDEAKRCTFVTTKFAVASYARAFAYTRDFKYKPLFDSAIQHLVESGIIKFKLREELPDTEICPPNLGNKDRQLRNSDLSMTYMIVGGGLAISALIFVIELFLKYCKHKHNVRKKHHATSVWVNAHQREAPLNNNNEKFGTLAGGKFVTPPPPYYSLFNPPANNENVKKKTINGRDYWVYDRMKGGERKMVPVRTPSALLFQYTN